jgi:hypothetical protein
VNTPQSRALDAFKHRPIVSAVLIALLVLLIFAARSHRGEDQSLGTYSAVKVSAAAVATDRLSHSG